MIKFNHYNMETFKYGLLYNLKNITLDDKINGDPSKWIDKYFEFNCISKFTLQVI
jgi:hypothetical protein